MEAIVKINAETQLQDLGGGVSRKVLSYVREMMVVEVHFEQGSVGDIHTHPHVQSTYVQSGKFCFDVDGEKVEVSQGDTLTFPQGVPHGTVCLEKGILIDVFTPMRTDFI